MSTISFSLIVLGTLVNIVAIFVGIASFQNHYRGRYVLAFSAIGCALSAMGFTLTDPPALELTKLYLVISIMALIILIVDLIFERE